MVIAESKDNKLYRLIYNESVLALNSNDKLFFIIENKELTFTLIFDFDNKGEPFSSTSWESPELNRLLYILHNWQSPSWVEIAKPVLLKGESLNNEYYLKFRSYSCEDSTYRKFEVSVWRGENEPIPINLDEAK